MRWSSEDKLWVSVFDLFLLPLGRPTLRLGGICLAVSAALTLEAAFSASVRTTCLRHNGKARREVVLTRAKLKKATLGTTRCKMPEKKRSRPKVFLPALVMTTSSPARM